MLCSHFFVFSFHLSRHCYISFCERISNFWNSKKPLGTLVLVYLKRDKGRRRAVDFFPSRTASSRCRKNSPGLFQFSSSTDSYLGFISSITCPPSINIEIDMSTVFGYYSIFYKRCPVGNTFFRSFQIRRSFITPFTPSADSHHIFPVDRVFAKNWTSIGSLLRRQILPRTARMHAIVSNK